MKKFNINDIELPREYYLISPAGYDYAFFKDSVHKTIFESGVRGIRDIGYDCLCEGLSINHMHLMKLISKFIIDTYLKYDYHLKEIDKEEFFRLFMRLLDDAGFFDENLSEYYD